MYSYYIIQSLNKGGLQAVDLGPTGERGADGRDCVGGELATIDGAVDGSRKNEPRLIGSNRVRTRDPMSSRDAKGRTNGVTQKATRRCGYGPCSELRAADDRTGGKFG